MQAIHLRNCRHSNLLPVLRLWAGLFPLALPAAAASGDADLAFNPAGGITIEALGQLPDGRIVLGKNADDGTATVVRADGTPDVVFNPLPNGSVASVQVSSDGRILLTGNFTAPRSGVVRYLPDGSLDASFIPGSNSDIYGAAVQPDGKIMVWGGFAALNGTPRKRIGRLLGDGSLDTSFLTNTDNTITLTTVLPGGKYLIAGAFTTVNGTARQYLARLFADGTLDTSFNPPVISEGTDIGWIRSMALQSDGKILIGGSFDTVNGVTRKLLVRLYPGGSVDESFSTPYLNDVVSPGRRPGIYSIVVQTDGKVLGAGNFAIRNGGGQLLFRCHPDGSRDEAFRTGSDSPGAPFFGDSLLQADGKIVVGGFFTSVRQSSESQVAREGIARLHNDPATQSLTASSASRLEWLRGGSSPETHEVQFDVAEDDHGHWVQLGAGSRINGGWELTGLKLPPGVRVRARARVPSGYEGGSSSLVQSVTRVPGPGVVDAPDITVSTAGTASLTNGAEVHAGSVLIGATGSLTFQIFNRGTLNLNDIQTTLEGPDAAQFTLTAFPASSLFPDGGTTVSLGFSPHNDGTKTAVLRIASNDPDESPFDIHLTAVAFSPSLPSAVTAGVSDLQATTAKLSGSADGHGVEATVFFDYGTTEAYGSAAAATPETVSAPVSVSAALSGLQPGTTYHYRIRAISGSGIGVSGDRTFTTPLLTAGRLDTAFGTAGLAPASGTSSVVVQTDGRIVAAGGSKIHRFLENGTPDPAFGTAGSISTNFPVSTYDRSVAVQTDGKVVVIGSKDGDLLVARFHPNGTSDSSFGTSGTVAFNLATGSSSTPSADTAGGLALQADGKMVISATALVRVGNFYSTRLYLIRCLSDGVLDPAFADGTPVLAVGETSGSFSPRGAATGVLALPDQKIAITGWSIEGNIAVMLYQSNGILDASLGGRSEPFISPPDHDEAYGAASYGQEGNIIIITGSAPVPGPLPGTSSVRKFLLYPTPVESPEGEEGRSVAIQPDGKVIVAGTRLTRHAGGRADPNFLAGPGGNSVALQSNGRILVAGSNGVRRYLGDRDVQFPDLSDPDNDGLPTMLELATGTSPLEPSSAVGSLTKNGDACDFTYQRRSTAPAEFVFAVEWSDTLTNPWSTGGAAETIVSDNGLLQQVRVALPSGGGKRFARLRVTRR